MADLLRRRSNGRQSLPYVEHRLSQYSHVLERNVDGELKAFLFLDRFMRDGCEHCYLGSLCSSDGEVVPMFRDLLRDLSRSKAVIHFAAEIENDRVLHLLHSVLPSFVPNTPGTPYGGGDPSIAAVFALHLRHIHGFDAETMTSETCEGLCGDGKARFIVFSLPQAGLRRWLFWFELARGVCFLRALRTLRRWRVR